MEPREIPQNARRILVMEIERWHREGTITAELAKTLRRIYDFDFQPPPSPSAPEATPVAQPLQSVQIPDARPRLTLAQTLLSETSIRIALYLGAFFVISAALILAALVATLRLPILLIVTVLFAGGALALKRRLPQPSFILYLVFSALLPITGGVLADMLNLAARSLTSYWMFVLFGMALIWAFSTRLYQSRFFSLTAILALDAALVMAGRLVDRPPLILFLFLLSFSSLAALGATFVLRHWQGRRMELPVFILAQVQQALILGIALILLINEGLPARNWSFITASTWFLTFVFVVLSNLLSPFVLYPWLAAAALIPVAWLAIVRSDSGPSVSALTLSLWGAVFTAMENILSPARERLRTYALPAAMAAIPLLLSGSISGLVHNRWLGFGLFLGTAILLSVAHILHKRTWVWSIALGFGLGAYFTFFHLPITRSVEGYWCSQLGGATLLLLLPDMLLFSRKLSNIWRRPLRGWVILTGSLVLLTGLVLYFLGGEQEARVALFTLGIIGCLYLAYGIRIHRSWLGALFSLHLTLSVALGLHRFSITSWLPILTCLAVLFYGCGIFLKWLKLERWSLVFRWSGLVLAGILSIAAFSYNGPARAFYVFVMAFLFLYETFQTHWLENIPPIIASMAFGMALHDARIDTLAYYPAGIAGIFLGLDLLYFRLPKREAARWLTLILGCLAAVLTPILVVVPVFEPVIGACLCAGLMAIFLVQALVYRKPRLGYSATGFFALAVLFADLHFFPDHWLWALILTAILFYGLGTLWVPLKRAGWAPVLSYSGLGLASLTAFSAPYEGSGLIASLPVALAATLWAVEAFRRRNVWLGLPANVLFLMAYFMILTTLRVEQPQFYSVGAAVLGMLMHHLLVRAGSRTGAFLMGMFSQLVLIGTSYIQFVDTEGIWYFVVMFLQSLAVLGYGIVIRSRSLVITPIILVAIGVVTVVFGALRGFSTVILVGMTGIALIGLGIAALLLRERITDLRDQLKNWRA